MAIEQIKLGGFVDQEVEKINSNFAQCLTEDDIPAVPTKLSQFVNDKGFQTETEVSAMVEEAVGEISVPTKISQLNNDAGFIKSTDAGFINKVDKEAGKGLSTNDYTTADKNKVANIGKIDFAASNFTLNTADNLYHATLTANGKYPVKVFRQNGTDFEEVLVQTKVSGTNIIVVSAESFVGYVLTI